MNPPQPKVYLTSEPRRGTPEWRRRRRRTVAAGTLVAVFLAAMFLTGTAMSFAAGIGAVFGAHHWDKHRRPDPDEVDVIACMLGVYLAGICIATVAGVVMIAGYTLLD